ncbi:YybS family protein [Neobacillus sp. SM06]|uniref:YybS family protein n=1 Tax=Neobacillus sp. SM06 TaxID=3422492 RepID=UPI003D2BD2AF
MKNARKLTEGAILLAAFMVLLLLTIYVPVIGIVVNLFLPVPFILFAVKNDWKSVLVFIVASLLISFITGTILALPLTLAYGTTGAIMGYMIQRQKSRTAILISASIVFLVNLVGQYIVSIVFFQLNYIDELFKTMQDSFKMSADIMKNFGSPQGTTQVLDQFTKALALLKTLLPSLFVMVSFLTVFIIQLLSLPILRRFGIKVENWKPFREISLPKSFIWYYLLTMLAGIVFHPKAGTYGFDVLTNLTYILQLFMVFQGLTFLFFFFHQRGTSKSIPVILAIFSFLVPILLYLIGILGIIDLGFGLRRRSEPRK